MTRTDALAARLRDLQARSTATDRAAAAALSDLKTAGAELAAAFTRMADELENQ